MIYTISVPKIVVDATDFPPDVLPSEDGVPLETDWHRSEINLLIELTHNWMRPREDYYVGGNMFIYFDADQWRRDRYFRGPDFFFVRGAKLNPPRPYWALWEEGGKAPDLIIELTSPSTRDADFGEKKDVYEKNLGAKEYFIYDPLEERLVGWRLNSRFAFEPIPPDADGRMWSEQLGLWLGTWFGAFQGKENRYLRFFDERGRMIPTSGELVDTLEAELRRMRGES